MTNSIIHKIAALKMVVGVVALCAMSPAAQANPLAGNSLVQPEADYVGVAEATPLSLGEMENMRGGFADPSGLVYRFAVNVQTLLNGIEVFTHSLVVAPSVSTGQLQATATTNFSPSNTPSGLNINMIGNGIGVVVTDSSGRSTTAMNQTANGAPASIIMNTGNDRNITQSVNVNLTLQNMTSIMNFIHTTSQVGAMTQHSALRSLGF